MISILTLNICYLVTKDDPKKNSPLNPASGPRLPTIVDIYVKIVPKKTRTKRVNLKKKI